MLEQIEVGEHLEIELPGGKYRTFDNGREFSEWFDVIDAAGNLPS